MCYFTVVTTSEYLAGRIYKIIMFKKVFIFTLLKEIVTKNG